MNKFIATGNLTKDVEIHYLNTGLACANFDLAISRKFKNSNGNIENEVCYIECKTFGKNAEIAIKEIETIVEADTSSSPLYLHKSMII